LLPVQGCVAEQPPEQIVPAQVLGAQSTVSTAGHAPAPLQAAASVARPVLAAQLGSRH
jgi:hypothetical protein